MLASIKKSGLKAKESMTNKLLKGRNIVKRHRKKFIIVFLILGTIALVTSLVLSAIEGVDITNQAVIINYTEQKILDGAYSNQVNLIGLNSKYFQVPKRKFLLYFQQNPQQSKQYWSPKITARSLQGTKLLVSARVSCQVKVQNLKNFLEQYGLNWRIYPIEKSKNVIIQKIAQTKFYQLNNSLIMSKVNEIFTKNLANFVNYPFTMKLVSLKIQYPSGSFSVNNTLGIQLLADKSLYSQLTSNYQRLSSNVTGNITDIKTLSSKIGQLQSKINAMEMQVNSMDPNSYWYAGISTLNNTFNNTTIQVRRFLWVYFQKIYNSTYNNYRYF